MISALNVKRHILDVLSTMGCIRKDQLYLYFEKMYPSIKDTFVHSVLYQLCKEGSVVEDEDYLYASQKQERNMTGVLFTWLLLEMIDDPLIHFDIGRFPTDFVVAKGENIFQVINYNDKGSFKLNYLNSKEQYPEGVVLLIILNNMSPEDIDNSLLPSEPYQFVSIDTNEDPSNPVISYSPFYNA